MAKQKGLTETAQNKPFSYLTWENATSKTIYKGKFRFYVAMKTATEKHINPKGRSTVITKFDVYAFNPWTGEFIGKKKMESYRGWEKGSGSSTGLIPVR